VPADELARRLRAENAGLIELVEPVDRLRRVRSTKCESTAEHDLARPCLSEVGDHRFERGAGCRRCRTRLRRAPPTVLRQVGRGVRRIATGSRRSRARSATPAVIAATAEPMNRAAGAVLSSPPPTAGAMVRPTHHEKPIAAM
jgi:hypothetical protein